MLEVRAKLDRDASDDEQPKDEHQRQVEAAECARVNRGKGENQDPTGGDQPNFVGVPYPPDLAQPLAPLLLGSVTQHNPQADPTIEADENHVDREHQPHQEEPESGHHDASAGAGPRPISRATRNRKPIPSSRYRPM